MKPVVPPYRRGGGFGSLGIRFQEVFEPLPIGFRPETVGAWITLGLLVAAFLGAVTWLVWRFIHRRYRREADAELRELSAAWEATPEKSAALETISVVLKRCALKSFERSKVASLSGESWIAFLTATGREPFGETAGRALLSITTRGAESANPAEVKLLFVSARRWVRRHRAER